MARNPDVDPAFSDARRWRAEAETLRGILLDSGLSEELKWGKPCYASGGRNICIVQRMNDFLALLFFKGALLRDPEGVLELQGPNSRSGYRIRFTSVEEVSKRAELIRAYVREAIEVEKAGLKIEAKGEPDYPDELIDKLDEDADFRAAFEGLTPGRRRGYVLHFSDAKRSKTRADRIEKYRSKIMGGQGLHDR